MNNSVCVHGFFFGGGGDKTLLEKNLFVFEGIGQNLTVEKLLTVYNSNYYQLKKLVFFAY